MLGSHTHGCLVTFSIPEKGNIIWMEGYDGVSNLEIKELLVECTFALATLQDELSCRLGPVKSAEKEKKDTEHLKYCQDKLKSCSERIITTGLSWDDKQELIDGPIGEAENEAKAVQHNQSLEVIKVGLSHKLPNTRDKYYDEFLWLVSRFVSPAHALLVKCSFGSNRVMVLDCAQRAKLLKYVKQNQDSLFCAKLEEATRLGLSIDDLNDRHSYVLVPSITRAVVAPEPSAIPSDSNYLLLMFHSLGNCEIPYILFERARSSQYRWTNDGDQARITALEAGLDQRLIDLLSDETRLIQAIHEGKPLVKLNTSTKGSWTCSIDNQLKIKLSQSLSQWTRDEWAIKFLRWILFVFPCDQFPSDQSVGKQLLPLLNLALSQFTQGSLPTYVIDDVAEALLAASRIGDMTSRQSAVTLATKILENQPPEHLLAYQKSTLLRIVADWKLSDYVIYRVSCSPSPPQALLISEDLFHNIKVYFKHSFRNMTLDDHGTLLLNGTKLDYGPCNDFDSYCFTATMLKNKGLHVEFRRALSKASALVEKILQAEHPRTLACFLEVFIHLMQTGLSEVTYLLREFIKRMSANVTRKGHPWGQICRLLGELDSESLYQAMAQTWKCTVDTFDSELGSFSQLTMSVRLDYIKRVYGITNHLEEERLLRDLLTQSGDIPKLSIPRVMLNLAHNLNRQGRHDEAEKMAEDVFSLLQKYEIYAGRIVERIESLKIVSRSQFNQGQNQAAEQTMQKAIQMIVDQWGMQHSWVPEFVNVLEGWLRCWGREEDANTLRGKIEELMGKDEVDK